MQFRLSNILNIFFRLLLIFFLVFIWIRYAFESLILSLILTILITLFLDFFIQFILNKKKYILNLKKQEIKKIEELKNTFIFLEESKLLNFFLNLASKKHTATKKNNFILIEHENNDNVILYPHFTFRKFNIDDLIFILNKSKKTQATKLVICSNDFDNDCKTFAKKLDIKILLLDIEQTYTKLLKFYDCFPQDFTKFKPEKSKKIKDLFLNSLSRNKTKSYLFASVIVLLSSFVIKFNVYYIIISSILLILALISFIRPKLKQPLPENIL